MSILMYMKCAGDGSLKHNKSFCNMNRNKYKRMWTIRRNGDGGMITDEYVIAISIKWMSMARDRIFYRFGSMSVYGECKRCK